MPNHAHDGLFTECYRQISCNINRHGTTDRFVLILSIEACIIQLNSQTDFL